MTSTNYCFCDLAPLYALNLLDESEREWVERQILETPELAEELSQYEIAATALPYSAPPVKVPDDLEGRLFDALELAPPEESSPLSKDSNDNLFLSVRFQDIEWQAHPVPGVEVSILHTDSIAQRISGVLKAAPGMQYPLHRHAGVEEIFMISGDLRVGTEIYGPGDYLRSCPGSVHAPHSQDGCMFFFNTSMNDDYLEKVEALT
jgi:quercetin dioxygenase-like cupin family protein